MNPNLYPRSFPIFAQSSLSLGASTVPKTSLQNIPFQSTWMTSSSPLLTDQKDDVGYVAEINKSVGVMNFISTTSKNDYNKYIDVKPYLPDFLRGTSDEVQKNVSLFEFTHRLFFLLIEYQFVKIIWSEFH